MNSLKYVLKENPKPIPGRELMSSKGSFGTAVEATAWDAKAAVTAACTWLYRGQYRVALLVACSTVEVGAAMG